MHQNMLKGERLEFILHQVNIHNKVLSTDLSQKLNVSDDTVRRDLNELADTGKLLKVHGGAMNIPSELAELGLPAASKYASIAAASAHAQHPAATR